MVDWAVVNLIAYRKAFNSMKSRLFIRLRTLIAAGVFVALGSSISRPIENPAIFNPADYSTVPPSSYQSGQFSNPKAPDVDGNLLITGNVRRGMHFRDTVQYGPTTSFRGETRSQRTRRATSRSTMRTWAPSTPPSGGPGSSTRRASTRARISRWAERPSM